MNNLQEKLELMLGLVDKGLKPDLWYEPRFGGFVLFHAPQYKGEWQVSAPWFPLEQVLELLPKELKVYAPATTLRLCLEPGEIGYKYPLDDVWCTHTQLFFKEEDSYLGALKLLKSTIEYDPKAVEQ